MVKPWDGGLKSLWDLHFGRYSTLDKTQMPDQIPALSEGMDQRPQPFQVIQQPDSFIREEVVTQQSLYGT